MYGICILIIIVFVVDAVAVVVRRRSAIKLDTTMRHFRVAAARVQEKPKSSHEKLPLLQHRVKSL